MHAEVATIQFHDDNHRRKSRLQYRNPRRPRTRSRAVVLDSFRYVRFALATGVRAGILMRALSGSNDTDVRVNLNDSTGIINRIMGTIKLCLCRATEIR